MPEISEFLETDIYPAVFSRLDTLLPEFDLQYKKGYWQSGKQNKLKTDGTEGSTTGSVYIYENRAGILKSFKASSPSKNLVAYITERDGITWIEAANYLAEQVNITLPHSNPEQIQKQKENTQIKEIWSSVENYFQYLLLHEKDGVSHTNYLKNQRGFTDQDIENTGFGLYPGKSRLKKYLLKAGYEEVKIDSLLNSFTSEEKFDLAIPVSDKLGRTEGFILRNINPAHKGDRYRYTEGYEKSKNLFNLNIRKASVENPLILVEGQIDCKLMESRGWENVVSINGSDLSDQQAVQILESKAKIVIFCLDGDSAGKTATEKGLEKLLKSQESEFLSFLIASLPEKEKDPNEVIKNLGEEKLKKAIDEALPLHIWLNIAILEKIKTSDGDMLTQIEEEKYLESIAANASAIKNQLTKGKFLDVFMQSRGEEAGITRQTIEEAAAKLRYNQQKEQEAKDLQRVTQIASRLLREGQVLEAKQQLENKLSQFVSIEIQEKVKPYTYSEFIEETATEPDDLITGIGALDRIIKIPQSAITLIAARPSHGKTTVMLNMFYNMIKHYPERQFFFFTYEEPAKYLLLKILNRILYEEFKYKSDLNFLRSYQAGKINKIDQVEQAKKRLSELITNKRLNIFSFNLNDKELSEAIKAQYKKGITGAVYIDYIQKIPVSQQAKGYEVIKQISNTILNKIAVPLQIPVILGAQFNREARANRVGELHSDMLREGGDLEQDANTILGLLNYNFVDETEDETGTPLKKGEISQIDIKTLKYRNGTPGKIANLELHGKHHYVQSLEKENTLNYLGNN